MSLDRWTPLVYQYWKFDSKKQAHRFQCSGFRWDNDAYVVHKHTLRCNILNNHPHLQFSLWRYDIMLFFVTSGVQIKKLICVHHSLINIWSFVLGWSLSMVELVHVLVNIFFGTGMESCTAVGLPGPVLCRLVHSEFASHRPACQPDVQG